MSASSIVAVQLTDIGNPDRMVEISVIGDEVFFNIGDYSEENDSNHLENIVGVGVTLEDLARALFAFGLVPAYKNQDA